MDQKEENLKYKILKYLNQQNREEILKVLNIGRTTFYRKVNAQIGEDGGFEYTQLLKIAEILEREPKELLSVQDNTENEDNSDQA